MFRSDVVEDAYKREVLCDESRWCPIGNFIDLTGQKFGMLTVVERAENKITPKGHSYIMWKCVCDCGETTVVSGASLRSGNTKSCGCYAGGKFKNMTGKKVGRLTVLKQDGFSKHGYAMWICQCECGNTVRVFGHCLRNGNTQSCGCLKNESAAKVGKLNAKINKYDLTGEYGIGYTNNNVEFYFDLEDYDKIKNISWSIDAYGYVVGHSEIHNNKKIRLHRLVMRATELDEKEFIVDHINHITTDDRKINLRIVTQQQNMMNTKITNPNGINGVYAYKDKWCASIGYKNQTVYLGVYNTKEDAIKARNDAESMYYGEYSYRKSMEEANAY